MTEKPQELTDEQLHVYARRVRAEDVAKRVHDMSRELGAILKVCKQHEPPPLSTDLEETKLRFRMLEAELELMKAQHFRRFGRSTFVPGCQESQQELDRMREQLDMARGRVVGLELAQRDREARGLPPSAA